MGAICTSSESLHYDGRFDTKPDQWPRLFQGPVSELISQPIGQIAPIVASCYPNCACGFDACCLRPQPSDGKSTRILERWRRAAPELVLRKEVSGAGKSDPSGVDTFVRKRVF